MSYFVVSIGRDAPNGGTDMDHDFPSTMRPIGQGPFLFDAPRVGPLHPARLHLDLTASGAPTSLWQARPWIVNGWSTQPFHGIDDAVAAWAPYVLAGHGVDDDDELCDLVISHLDDSSGHRLDSRGGHQRATARRDPATELLLAEWASVAAALCPWPPAQIPVDIPVPGQRAVATILRDADVGQQWDRRALTIRSDAWALELPLVADRVMGRIEAAWQALRDPLSAHGLLLVESVLDFAGIPATPVALVGGELVIALFWPSDALAAPDFVVDAHQRRVRSVSPEERQRVAARLMVRSMIATARVGLRSWSAPDSVRVVAVLGHGLGYGTPVVAELEVDRGLERDLTDLVARRAVGWLDDWCSTIDGMILQGRIPPRGLRSFLGRHGTSLGRCDAHVLQAVGGTIRAGALRDGGEIRPLGRLADRVPTDGVVLVPGVPQRTGVPLYGPRFWLDLDRRARLRARHLHAVAAQQRISAGAAANAASRTPPTRPSLRSGLQRQTTRTDQ